MGYNRFLVFGSEKFYPSGGAGDYLGRSATMDGALKVVEDFKKTQASGVEYWWQVWDQFRDDIVADQDGVKTLPPKPTPKPTEDEGDEDESGD